jgi:hypothetical protein
MYTQEKFELSNRGNVEFGNKTLQRQMLSELQKKETGINLGQTKAVLY